MRPAITLCALLFLHSALVAQGPLRNWRFGINVAVDMLANPPAFETGSALASSESCVSVSDDDGNLLFYSEGLNVYDANEVTMPNGTGLLCNSMDWQQGVVTCPWPGFPSKHLIFHTGMDHVLRWSVVDMSLNGGTGDVALKNLELASGVSEAMTIARHANGTDYWLVVRNYVADQFQVFPITFLGVGAMHSSVTAGMNTEDFTGMVRFNRTHRWMAATMRGAFGNTAFLGLFLFDPQIGVLGNGTLVPTYAPWGVEFSCDGHYFYLSHNDLVPIQQFDMLAGTPAEVLASAIDATVPITAFDMAIAPDNRIYFVWNDGWNRGARVLGALLHPGSFGTGCSMQDSVVVWTYPFAANSTCLPNFMQLPLPEIVDCSTPVGIEDAMISNAGPSMSATLVQEGMWLRWPAAHSGFAFEVVDATGRVSRTAIVRGTDHWLDAQELRAGSYFLRMTTNDGQLVRTQRFVKQ